MDKETLSNYGWIVIAVLVLVVMIALATPFGKFISNAVKSTTEGLFDVNQKALNGTGLLTGDQQIKDQDIMVPGDETTEPEVVVGSATFAGYYDDNGNYVEEKATLTWDKLQLTDNGDKYGYDAYAITDTSIGMAVSAYYCDTITSITIPDSVTTIGMQAFIDCPNLTSVIIGNGVTKIDLQTFMNCTSLTFITIGNNITSIEEGAFNGCSSLTEITLPSSITSIGFVAFGGCSNLEVINFEGTMAQWNAISFGEEWNWGCPEITVTCTNGTIIVPVYQ